MTHKFSIGEEVDCSRNGLHGTWVVEQIEPFKGQDGEPRLTVESTEKNYTKQTPVIVTASSCLPIKK